MQSFLRINFDELPPQGETLLISLAKKGVLLDSPCGGKGSCGKCRVRIISGNVNGKELDEQGSVLACEVSAASDLTIEIPNRFININSQDNRELTKKNLREKSFPAGIALDVGTTSIAASLMDLESKECLDTISQLNEQSLYGADVMSRISAAREGKTEDLFKLINQQTQKIIKNFIDEWKLEKIEKLCVSANTVMLHLFLNIDPSAMGEVPFTPVFLEEKILKGSEIGLPVEDVVILPSITSFVGADIVSGITALDLLDSKNLPSLFIDIGTNGEMAIIDSEKKILCCSTAAGPAFEGAEIHKGMGGVLGAICSVSSAEEGFSISTIGNVQPLGICGSGLVDALAVLLERGIVDETGRMEDYPEGFYLVPEIALIPKDIRQFQLAKSAILSGIKILCKNGGLKLDQIKSVHVAGGFGFYVNKDNAIKTGILPPEFDNKISVWGNLSLRGAEMALLTEDFLEKCRNVVRTSSHVELSLDPDFMEEFAENMLFNTE